MYTFKEAVAPSTFLFYKKQKLAFWLDHNKCVHNKLKFFRSIFYIICSNMGDSLG